MVQVALKAMFYLACVCVYISSWTFNIYFICESIVRLCVSFKHFFSVFIDLSIFMHTHTHTSADRNGVCFTFSSMHSKWICKINVVNNCTHTFSIDQRPIQQISLQLSTNYLIWYHSHAYTTLFHRRRRHVRVVLDAFFRRCRVIC